MHWLSGTLLQGNSQEPGEAGLTAAPNSCMRKLISIYYFVKSLVDSNIQWQLGNLGKLGSEVSLYRICRTRVLDTEGKI